MHQLNLPTYKHKLKHIDGEVYIFDRIRKKDIILTPEEWVRQNLIQYLIQDKGFPSGLISVEAGLKVNTLNRRYDALVYSRNGNANVLIECKAPEVNVNKKVFDQVLAYNLEICAPYLLVSNGIKHFFLGRGNNETFSFLPTIPNFDEL